MISPSQQKIIQIDVTNACIHKCSHCTRFCGHHSESFFMSTDAFKKAVDSLEGYPGMVGMMGGEPTLHPDFEEMSLYMKEKIPNPEFTPLHEPVGDFVDYRNKHLQDVDRNKRGIWSSLGKRYYENFEVIQDVFPYQCINDHMNEGLHQALLIPRSELGVSDEDWIPLRDNCWIQNLWSASITPKGAFFCEVAAALDMLFDGPGGWPVEEGWWKRTPAEFGEQLKWCELCSAPLRVPRLRAKDERDIVSPLMYEKLKGINSPKLAHDRVVKFDINEYEPEEYVGNPSDNPEWYLPDSDNSTRVSGTNVHIYPHSIVAFAAPAQETGSLGKIDEQSFVSMDFKDWCAVLPEGTCIPPDLEERLKSVVLNPGYVYFYNPVAQSVGKVAWKEDDTDPGCLLILINRQAHALKSRASLPTTIQAVVDLWPPERRIAFGDDFDVYEQSDTHESDNLKTSLMISHLLSLWRVVTAGDDRVALYGAGKHTQFLLSIIQHADLPLPSFIADDNCADGDLCGVGIVKSDSVSAGNFDVIFISSDAHADVMADNAGKTWPDKVIVNPYAHFEPPAFTKRVPKD